jgi:hypothetical protein
LINLNQEASSVSKFYLGGDIDKPRWIFDIDYDIKYQNSFEIGSTITLNYKNNTIPGLDNSTIFGYDFWDSSSFDPDVFNSHETTVEVEVGGEWEFWFEWTDTYGQDHNSSPIKLNAN